MNDRDDYPDNPYRGRADREGGYDYDPLSDPLPAQPPPRGRRARPEPPSAPRPEQPGTGEFGHTGPSTGEFRTPRYASPPSGEFDPQGRPGRRRRAEPPADEAPWTGERPTAPPRRSGAAEALRGSRAARGGGQDPQRPGTGSPSDTGSHQRPGGDPTQEALAALANLGGAPTTPTVPGDSGAPSGPGDPSAFGGAGGPGERGHGQAEEPSHEEPPRRARRARAEEPAEPRSPLWDDDPDEPVPAFLADEPEEEPRGRRSRRKRARGGEEEPSRDTGSFAAPQEEEPAGRRGRRRSRRAAAEEPADTGAFRASPPQEEEPAGRGGRRRSRRAAAEEPADTGSFAEAPADPSEEEPSRDTGSFAAPLDEEPAGRRGGRRRARRSRRGAPDPEPPVEDEAEEDLYEEERLEDIAAAYGNSRANRKRARRAKAAQAARRAAGKPRRRRSKGLMILLALVLMLVVAGGGYGVMRTYVFPADHSGEGEGEVVFTIEEGESGTAIAQRLVDQDVVASVRAFTNALNAMPEEELGEGLVPGTYSLAEGMSGQSAVTALLDPANRLGGGITIREGLRSEQVLEHLADNTGLDLDELRAAYEQTDELGLPEYATEGPEGYLFPATYEFEPGTEALAMLRTMVTQHRQVATEIDLEGKAAALGYDANEIMAIASIVQAESGGTEDMPKISRVVHNRLDIEMPLQMDSTCFYAIGEYGIALNSEQLAACEADTSGFDTYHKPGLIPGPFVAPGQDAIEAALEPAEGEWLYFVATDPENGVTEFAETHEEFEVLKERFEETWGGGGN
ncbi:hypothetical protein GCM10007079_40280 [Nocardiopsis terrae]|uniref:Endolytic murein transglycosylase n=1 Tax=Nocardiopsis terrae TaxID=372655 RepID=A0ABR9HEF6_9ACTN|nr:endolytic transglycosylase MltG [Nocardiopsis terrae]MBE1457414.1 UPF0755 protein [Nocardiopsis terrae]GHC92070.1 hypothetical protein GCM10007079_40280 [Nocardiopsis terrae]